VFHPAPGRCARPSVDCIKADGGREAIASIRELEQIRSALCTGAGEAMAAWISWSNNAAPIRITAHSRHRSHHPAETVDVNIRGLLLHVHARLQLNDQETVAARSSTSHRSNGVVPGVQQGITRSPRHSDLDDQAFAVEMRRARRALQCAITRAAIPVPSVFVNTPGDPETGAWRIADAARGASRRKWPCAVLYPWLPIVRLVTPTVRCLNGTAVI